MNNTIENINVTLNGKNSYIALIIKDEEFITGKLQPYFSKETFLKIAENLKFSNVTINTNNNLVFGKNIYNKHVPFALRLFLDGLEVYQINTKANFEKNE